MAARRRGITSVDTEQIKGRMKIHSKLQYAFDTMKQNLLWDMPTQDLRGQPRFKGLQLLPLGELPSVSLGNVSCSRYGYLGENGKFYVEGPYLSRGKVVIGIRTYGIGHVASSSPIEARHWLDLMANHLL